MSGQDVPYQLRPNKFVERQLFLDILDFARVWNGPSHYVYASMGGKFLEDFKLINNRFAIDRMISIEGDRLTWERQQFNKPLGFVECRHQMSNEFVDEFTTLVSANVGCRFIVWLDFASAGERGLQLAEYEDLVSKLSVGDVVKITLNANPEWFRKRSDFVHKRDYLETVFGAIKDQLGEYKPRASLTEESITARGFAELLASAVKIAGAQGISRCIKGVCNAFGDILLLRRRASDAHGDCDRRGRRVRRQNRSRRRIFTMGISVPRLE